MLTYVIQMTYVQNLRILNPKGNPLNLEYNSLPLAMQGYRLYERVFITNTVQLYLFLHTVRRIYTSSIGDIQKLTESYSIKARMFAPPMCWPYHYLSCFMVIKIFVNDLIVLAYRTDLSKADCVGDFLFELDCQI